MFNSYLQVAYEFNIYPYLSKYGIPKQLYYLLLHNMRTRHLGAGSAESISRTAADGDLTDRIKFQMPRY